MHPKLLDVLACPICRGELTCRIQEASADGEILRGVLSCAVCPTDFPIDDAIPRFTPRDNYASSFGYQWNLFRAEQIDASNGSGLSASRFFSETGWPAPSLQGQWILDAGCGAGRFLDVAAGTGAEVVGLDISTAIDASRKTIGQRPNVHFVQASITALPFRKDAFDRVYCIGVIQHTPDPADSLRNLPSVLKPGGEVAVTIYERKPWTLLNAKYWVRPFTKRLDNDVLLKIISTSMPVAFPVTDVLFRIPLIGRLFEFVIPVANYVREARLDRKQRYRWAVLDTFDMLSPAFDMPQKQTTAEAALKGGGVDTVRRLPNPGLNLVGRKA